jgi:hypothetical protein
VELESLMLALGHGMRVAEVPVRMEARRVGRSTITPARSAVYGVRVALGLAVVVSGRRAARQAPA